MAFLLTLLAVTPTALAGDLRLVEAARNQDQQQIRTLLNQHVDVNGRSGLRFHRNCLSIWQREVVSPHREIAGGSAAAPWTLLFDLHVARRAGRDRAAYEEFRAAIAEAWLMAAETQAHSRRVRAERLRPRRSQV